LILNHDPPIFAYGIARIRRVSHSAQFKVQL
jgi:hypothetical protein